MCIICASIPAAAAVGANLPADQLGAPAEKRNTIWTITALCTWWRLATSLGYTPVSTSDDSWPLCVVEIAPA